MQSAYLPWIGYLQRIKLSDAFVVLDHVQLNKNSKTKFSNRNRIRTPEGWSWLTVPLKTRNLFGDLAINHLEIDDAQEWAVKHARSIRHGYARAPHFANYSPELLAIYATTHRLFAGLALETIQLFMAALRVKVATFQSSQMGVVSDGSQLILDLCRELGATEYLSGPFGRDYLDRASFEASGIKLLFHEYEPVPYRQCFPGFEPCLSALDLIFNLGPHASDFLQNGAKLHES